MYDVGFSMYMYIYISFLAEAHSAIKQQKRYLNMPYSPPQPPDLDLLHLQWYEIPQIHNKINQICIACPQMCENYYLYKLKLELNEDETTFI